MTARVAVVLFNLGGPDGPEAVEPFLFNLFNDRAIIGAPGPVRWLLAKLISKRRAPVAREIYAQIGGRSPLRELTEAQAAALEDVLRRRGLEARVFICMRYWHPRSSETVRRVADVAPEAIVLLPLYPQFSTTTTESAVDDWKSAAAAAKIETETYAVCCYPSEKGWIAVQAALVDKALIQAESAGRPRILFSAHGLPKKIVDRGDPYPWQVERTASAVVEALTDRDVDYRVCYQSRVGLLEWIGPSTEEELENAAADNVAVVVVPIAFVSEHSETLVELDIEYRDLAEKLGVPAYVRVPAVGTNPAFVGGLADTVEAALVGRTELGPAEGGRLCPDGLLRCPCRDVEAAGGA